MRRARIEQVRNFSVPIKDGFCSFVEALGMKLHPGQRALCEVAFDGKEITTPLHRQLFGPVEEKVPALARGAVVLVCGARAGKTRLCAARALHLALTVPIDQLGAGEQGVVLVMAPKIDLANQAFRYIVGFIGEAAGAITARAYQKDQVTVVREDGEVRIECMPADARGASGRGKSLLGVVMDEVAFFRDSRHVVNDTDIYTAVSPRVLPGGQILLASTPWADSGLLFDFYQANFGKPRYALVAHAPTLVLNPTKAPEVERERMRNAENARREFDAEFGAGEVTHYFPATQITRAQVEDMTRPMPFPHESKFRYAAAGDLGFKRDAAALLIAEYDGEKYRPAHIVERKPKSGNPLAFGDTMREFVEILQKYNCHSLVIDQYHREAVRDSMGRQGIAVVDMPAGPSGLQDMASRVRRLLGEGKIEVNVWRPDGAPGAENNSRRLLRQLKEVRFRMMAGGQISLEVVRRGGQHGDIAVAFMGAIWHLWSEQISSADEIVEPFSDEWHAKRQARQLKDMRRAALERAGASSDEEGWSLDGWGDEA